MKPTIPIALYSGLVEMKAEKLYESLDKQFELDKLHEDEWSSLDLGEYITDNFKQTWMGLVLDNAKEVEKVYTAVFPSERVLDKILSSGERNVLLFTHHPMIWDHSTGGYPFRNISSEYLEKLKEQAISHYSIHVPLDRNGPYSTTASLARALEIETEREFFDYHGVMVGIIGSTECKTVLEMAEKVKELVGHNLKIWNYGTPQISNQKVALVAGGGNFPEIVEELAETDVRIYITGVTRKNPNWEPGLRFHEICKENKINVIGATHYSTEKFACIAVLKFFETLGLSSAFIEGEPSFDDYE
ncbi:MAG: Nif3-like dinuclear metal center hexameric protein [Candidatus Thorarchaeota archaeon]|jgi:putative NIF3 family GTP cyclohydrolase 1 type 2